MTAGAELAAAAARGRGMPPGAELAAAAARGRGMPPLASFTTFIYPGTPTVPVLFTAISPDRLDRMGTGNSDFSGIPLAPGSGHPS